MYVFWHDIVKVILTFTYTSNVVAYIVFFAWRVFLDAQSHALLNCKELEVLSASWIPGSLVNGHTLCNFSRLTLLPRLWLQGKTLDSNTLKVKIKKLFKKIAAGLKLSLESWQLMGSNLDTSGWCQVKCVCVCVSSDIWYTWSYFVVCCLEDLRQVGKEVEKTTLFVKCIS